MKETGYNLNDLLDNLSSHCHEHGMRITPQRTAVYELLLQSKEHPTVEMIHKQLRKKFPNVSLDTVNRTLHTLADLGLAEVVPGSGGAKRFDAPANEHQHFRCVKCQNIIDFDYDEFENIKLPRKIREKFTIMRKSLYLEGICENCRSKNNN